MLEDVNHQKLEERLWRTVRGCGQQIITMAEVSLHGDKLDQDANSIYPQEWSVTFFPLWKMAPLFGYLGYLFPYCQPFGCKRRMDRYTFRIQDNL